MSNLTCSVEGCAARPESKGMCSKHYTRWRRHGTTEYVGHKPKPKRTCTIPGCGADAKYTKWCSKHYERWLKHGDPLGGRARYNSPEESFAARTERQGDCLIWLGAVDRSGYGIIATRGHHQPAHRWSYEKHVGPIGQDMRIDHMCHTPACVEPTHLRQVTQKQNGENRKSANKNNGTSSYQGVSYCKRTGKWAVKVMHNRKTHWGGRHETEEQAAQVAAALRNQLFTHNDLDRTP